MIEEEDERVFPPGKILKRSEEEMTVSSGRIVRMRVPIEVYFPRAESREKLLRPYTQETGRSRVDTPIG